MWCLTLASYFKILLMDKNSSNLMLLQRKKCRIGSACSDRLDSNKGEVSANSEQVNNNGNISAKTVFSIISKTKQSWKGSARI